jgi:two-component system CheB/CheR fusion protein
VGARSVTRAAPLAGRRWQDLGFLAPEAARVAFEEAVAMREPRRLARLRMEIAGAETMWDCSLIPVQEAHQQEIRHVVVSAVDVTDQVRAQAELERTDRLKDQFLALASHELRTPLTPLSMYSEVLRKLLAERNRDPAWERRMLDTVGKFQSQISQIARLTDDLVDVARLESGRLSVERKPVDLKALLSRAREQSIASSPEISVKLSLPDEPKQVIVNGDQQRLLQVIGNLLGNAVRHATGTQRLDVSLRAHETEGKRYARIEVRDHGPGIAPEVMEALFTRFSKGTQAAQAARSGLGLGLFICRGIVEQHGGTIRASSKPGEGATFIVELPIAD